MALNPQAEELNTIIKEHNQHIYNLLSEKGKAIFFPKLGILGQTAEAKGKKINATIGIAVEDDGTPMRLASIAKEFNLKPKDAFPYAPSYGKQELRGEWQKLIYEKNPSLEGKTISLPVVTNALTHGLSMAAYLFINPGEEIILPDLFWGNYKLMFLNGYDAKFNTYPTFVGEGFNVNGLKEKLSEGVGKKIVMFNFPNNPTGYTATEKEFEEIVQVLLEAAEQGNEIVVLIDDAYFGLVYKDGFAKDSLFAHLADLHENILAVKVDGATKEDYVWGFRVGFVTFSAKGISHEVCETLASKTAGAVRGSISNAPHVSQSLVLRSYTSPTYKQEKKEKYELLKSRFEKVEQVLSMHPEYADVFQGLPFNSGYFMCVKLKKGIDAEKVRKKLLSDYDTGIIAMGDIVRIAFSSVQADLIPDLFDNVYKACQELLSS